MMRAPEPESASGAAPADRGYRRTPGLPITPACGPSDGYTLVELLVYAAFMVLVLAIAGGILLSSLTANATVRSTAEASNLGQLLSESLRADARSAVALKTTAPSVGVTGAQYLVIERLAAGTNQCRAWLYLPSAGGQLFTRTGSSLGTLSAPSASAIAAALAADPVEAPAGWQSYGEGIVAASPGPFVVTSARIDFTLEVDAGDAPAVLVDGSEISRQTVKATSPCF